MNDDDKATAALVLAKCASNDPYFPGGGESMVLAWAEVFEDCGLSREDLLAGVTRGYAKAGEDGFRPLPGAIVAHGRAAYFDQLKALPDAKRELMEEANHVLQDMGFPPPVAHRWSRHMALGRGDALRLADDQLADFRQRMADRKALGEQPPRRPEIPDGLGKPPEDA